MKKVGLGYNSSGNETRAQLLLHCYEICHSIKFTWISINASIVLSS